MKSRTKQSLMKRVNSQSSFATTCKSSDTGTSFQLHRTIRQHSSIASFLLLLIGAGLGAVTAQAQAGAYVTNFASNTVSAIDTATNNVVATIPVGIQPQGIAITPDGTRAYVANQHVANQVSATVSVIDTTTNTVVTTISVGLLPQGVAITPDGTRAYVTNVNPNTVSVIDTANNTVVATIPVGVEPFGVAITPDGTRAYVANVNSNTISVIDTANNTVVATIPVDLAPFGVTMTPAPQVPTSIKQCENGGYLKFGPPAGPFKNQGQCVSYVEHHSH